jgi:hypothetical protein
MDNSKKHSLFILHQILVDLRSFAHAGDLDRITALSDCAELIPELILSMEGPVLFANVKSMLYPFDQKFGHLLRRYGDMVLDPHDPIWSP